MRKNILRDRRLNYHLDEFLKISDPLKKNFNFNFRDRKKFRGFDKNFYSKGNYSTNEMPYRKKSNRLFGLDLKRKKFTVEDMLRVKELNNMTFTFVNDDDFIIFAKVDMK